MPFARLQGQWPWGLSDGTRFSWMTTGDESPRQPAGVFTAMGYIPWNSENGLLQQENFLFHFSGLCQTVTKIAKSYSVGDRIIFPWQPCIFFPQGYWKKSVKVGAAMTDLSLPTHILWLRQLRKSLTCPVVKCNSKNRKKLPNPRKWS